MLWSGSYWVLWRILLLGLVIETQPVATSNDPGSGGTYHIQWKPCSNGSVVECGTLQVPIDWANTSSPNVTLGMTRVNASDPSKRKGSLLFNPGGPGNLASILCYVYKVAFGAELVQYYDLVCPDPRGVGTSTPVLCEPDIWNQNISSNPTNETEFKALVQWSKERGDSCLNLTGELLRHVDTGSAARDLDAIRSALGDDKLNWLGLSYGSALGAEYTRLFPENVGAMVFDGVETMMSDPTATLFVKSTTYENSLQSFFEWCQANATRCGFSSLDVKASWQNLISEAMSSAIAAAGCTGSGLACKTEVTASDIILNAQPLLIWQNQTLGFLPGWERLGQALNQTIVDGDATLFSTALAQSQNDTMFAAAAIQCLDWQRAANVSQNESNAYATYQQLQLMGGTFNPAVGIDSNAWLRETTCVAWPVPPVPMATQLNTSAAAQLPPILMVASNHDPFTSYVWALSVKQQYPNATLVTREGNGHTSYFLKGESSKIIEAFFVNGTIPQDGTIVTS